MDRGARLAELTDKAMDKMDEILDIDLNDVGEDYGRIVSVQKDAAVAVMNVQIKADDQKFRMKQSDALEGLLSLVRAAQVKTLDSEVS